jgi:hypothetical protein
MTAGTNISRETAIKLCEEIRAENENKGFSFQRLQCWGCLKYAKGDVEKMCLANEKGGGCNLINKRYKSQQGHK